MASNSGSVLSKINTPLFSEGAKIIEIFYELYVADERIGDVLGTIRHITLNVENVRGLRRLNAGRLSTRDLAWIDALIGDTADAIGELAALVERARVDKETKEKISWWNKGCWVAYFGPKVREKYQKLTMCHQSLLAVFPFLFNNHSGLASVLEETKGDNQQPCDPTMMKWLGWQDQQQRRRSNTSFKTPTLSQRPMSARSSLTDMTHVSAVSSNSSASTGPTELEASSPEIGISYYPAAYSQSYSPTSASVSPQTRGISCGSYNEKYSSRSRESPHLCGSPDLVTDSMDSTYPVFDNNSEANHDPPSALPKDANDGRNDDLTPSTKPLKIDDGADGLQVYAPPLDGSEVLRDSVHQLQISSFDAQTTKSSPKIAIGQRNDKNGDPAKAISLGGAFGMPKKVNEADSPTETVHKATPGRYLPSSSYFPPFDFERSIELTPSSVTGQSSELRALDGPEDGAEPSLEDKKPPIDRSHSDTYTPRYTIRSRPELSQSGRVHAPSEGGRSLSAGQRGARRGSRSWLAFHSSRSDLRQGGGWGER